MPRQTRGSARRAPAERSPNIPRTRRGNRRPVPRRAFQGQHIAVLKERARLACVQRQRLFPAPAQLQQAAALMLFRPRDRARAKQIAHPHRAARRAVVRQLLGGRVIHLAEIGARDHRLAPAFGCQTDLQRDVVVHRPRLGEVGQKRHLALRRRDAEGLQRRGGHDPGRDRRGGRLGLEGAERLVLPGLDIARRPVVQQHIAEDVREGLAHRERAVRRLADDGPDLQLNVEPARGREDRCVELCPLDLAMRPRDRRARDNDRRGAPVIADGDVEPVRRQRVLGPTEHRADVEGVVPAGIEIGELRDREGHQERRL